MAAGAFTCVTCSGCQTAPITGRGQLVLIPEAQEIALGQQAYEQSLANVPLSQNAELVTMVSRVGRRIAAAANRPDYDWEFRVIAKDEMNAFALPGGKVAVYEGILPVCQDEAGLAVVMSHEVAHAIARHGGERMSQQATASGIGGAINIWSRKKTDDVTADNVMQLYGAASQYGVILPFSRKHESEADAIGLILMAKAGYDPSVAPEFWERFSRQSGTKPPELLSTHPADVRRAADLRAMLPEAMSYYDAAPVQLGIGDVLPIRIAKPQSLAATSPVSSATSLQNLSFTSRAPQKAGNGSPPPLPTKVQADSNWDVLAAADTSAATHEDFLLPVPVGKLPSPAFDPYRRSSPATRTIDDGWEATPGQARLP